jgi:hypothetical protein
MLFGVRGGATKYFGEKRSNVGRMFSAHVGKDWCKDLVVLHMLIEARGQTAQRVDATEPLIEGRNVLIGHGQRVACGLTFEFTRARKAGEARCSTSGVAVGADMRSAGRMRKVEPPTEAAWVLCQRSDIVDDDTFPERPASGDKPCVMLALGLVERVVFQRLEVKRCRKVKRVIRDRAAFGLGRRTYEAPFEIRNLREALNLRGKDVAFSRSEILA